MTDKYNQRWVMLLAQDGCASWAVTLGQTTYYSCPETEVDAAWHRHEDKHKEQWRRDGRILFALKYLWYTLRYGYLDNPYEIEARIAENHIIAI